MKTPEPPKENPSAPNSAKFTGTDNPRHLRAIAALLRRIDYRSVDLRDVDSVSAAVSDLVHRKCVSYLAIPPGLYISTCEGLALGGALVVARRKRFALAILQAPFASAHRPCNKMANGQ